MKRIIAMILTATVSALILTACAGPGDIDVAAEDGAEKLDITALPSKFDLRNADGSTPVSNSMPWALANSTISGASWPGSLPARPRSLTCTPAKWACRQERKTIR